MRQPGAVVIAGRREKHLRLVLQTPEGLAVDDAVAVALEGGPHIVLGLRAQTPAGVGASGGLGREDLALARFELFADGHEVMSERKLAPCTSGPTPKTSASVWPTSANVRRVPRSAPARTCRPVASSGTYSRE
jgi:hypothetical protein